MSLEEAPEKALRVRAADGKPEPVVAHNDWGVVAVPSLGEWTPTLATSVVIPARGAQARLELTLAALSRQSYPMHLLEVVVADDGSAPPLELPEIRPENTRIVRVTEGWGRAAACHAGALAADGDVIHWLDSDMIPFRRHVEAQLRWQHSLSYAVTLGYKRFVPDEMWAALTPQGVASAVADDSIETCFPAESLARHEWIEEIIDATEGLRRADARCFRVHVGATATVRRELYLDAGGMDVGLRLGEDSELAFRLAGQGAVFVPEPLAGSWHLGASHVMKDAARVQEYNAPFFAQRVPLFTHLRSTPQRQWAVPRVEVVVDASEAHYKQVRATVDRLLAGEESDLRVALVAPWTRLMDERTSVLTDEDFGLRALHEFYSAEPRVQLVESVLPTSFPVPFRCEFPVDVAPGQQTVRRMVAAMENRQVGLVQALVPGSGRRHRRVVRLVRTAALHRVWRIGNPKGSLDDRLDEVFGSWWLDGEQIGLAMHDDNTVAEPLTQWHVAASREVQMLKRRLYRVREDRDRLRAQQDRLRRSPLGRVLRRIGWVRRLAHPRRRSGLGDGPGL